MARVYIDPHCFGSPWFLGILPELVGCESVIFVYGGSEKHVDEMQKVRQALSFYKTVGSLKGKSGSRRRVDASSDELHLHEERLKNLNCFKNCEACDDAHIYALVYTRSVKFVFSLDKRMRKCRRATIDKVDSKYFKFSSIRGEPDYRAKKGNILR